MNLNFVTNITHFLDENGAIPKKLTKEGRVIADGLGEVITCVTSGPRKSPQTDVLCWSEINNNLCAGKIDAGIDLENSNILWSCKKCGDRGSISSWENTFWDCGYRQFFKHIIMDI